MASQATPIAVFDISSSSVGGAHALVSRNSSGQNAVTILVQERRDSGLDDELNIERFVEDTTKALEVVIDHVRTADVHHPEAIQILLSSPWYVAHTRTIVYNKTTVFSCTRRLVDSLIEKEVEFLLKQASTTGDAFGSNFKVVEQQITEILVNGYPTGDAFGKKGQSLQITLMVTLVPDVVVDRFTSVLRRSYGDRKIHVTTAAHAAYVALRDNGGVQANCLIVDVGEEVTDIAFVKNNLFLSQHSFPIGTYELYRSLGAYTGSTSEARTLVEAYRLKKLSPGNVRLVEKAIQTFALQWQKSLHLSIEEGAQGFRIPAQWYITADHRFETLFPALLSSDTFLQHTSASKDLQVTFIKAMSFSGTIKTMSAEDADANLTIGALFIERLL
ncbi:MAG: hypothetical protein ABIO57_03925 [Candidatus Paceibacterota bacterium]